MVRMLPLGDEMKNPIAIITKDGISRMGHPVPSQVDGEQHGMGWECVTTP